MKGSEPVPLFGFPFEVGVEPIQVDVERMIRAYRAGVKDLQEIYGEILEPGTRDALGARAAESTDAFHIPDALWVHLIYEFAAAYHQKRLDRDHLMQSLVPLYLGRTASFVREVRESNAREVEERIETLCRLFEAEKPYLVSRWEASRRGEQSHARTT